MDEPQNILTAEAPAPVAPKRQFRITPMMITIFLVILVVVALILVVFLGSKVNTKTQTNKDKEIIGKIFDLRNEASDFYQKNQAYETWQPSAQILTDIQNLKSEVIIRKPDHQNYIMYVYLPGDKNYVCIDTQGFAGQVGTVSQTQTKCQP